MTQSPDRTTLARMSSGDWSDTENDAVVAAYFAMLGDELSGQSYNKAAHNRLLQEQTGRSRGSIEFKLCNVSAAVRCFAQPMINGYLPRYNFQSTLEDAVARWLAQHPQWEAGLARPQVTGMGEDRPLEMTVPPTLKNSPPPDETEKLQAVARRFDVAGRDERNRALGFAGEELVYHRERGQLLRHGRDDLAGEVVWVSKEEGDGAGYDIKSFTPEGRDRLIEVKTTNGWERTPFHISRNELEVAEARRDDWVLFRLYEFARIPKAFELRPPLEAHVALTATSFQASFG
jgi:hypothetical protein